MSACETLLEESLNGIRRTEERSLSTETKLDEDKKRDLKCGRSDSDELSLVDREKINTSYYVKFRNHQPVLLETHFSRQKDREVPLATVGDLVAVFFNWGEPTDIDHYTLFYVPRDGKEMIYDFRTPLSELGDNGTDGSNPLMIRSSMDAMLGLK